MARVLIVGAGGVGQVVAHKCAQVPEVFTEIVLASRTEENAGKSPRRSSVLFRPHRSMPTILHKWVHCWRGSSPTW